jgi:molybdenum cofactor biosynthesis protein B
MTLAEHRGRPTRPARCWIATLSDTRTAANDRGGRRVRQHLEAGGHEILGTSILREAAGSLKRELRALLGSADLDVLLCTGGTGVAPRDNAYDVLQTLYDREIPGFGELFRMLSWKEIGSAALLSRASAGVVGSILVVSIPGSTAAIDLAMSQLVLPELGHLLGELQRATDTEGTP